MANFPKSHGLEIRQNGYIKNTSIEELDTDPTILNNSGRLWFNTTDLHYKGTFRDSNNNIIIKQFPTLDDLEDAVSNASITISDEGNLVSNTVTKINFIGANVQAMSDDGKEVNVYMPPPTFTSHWNTSDGTVSSCLISDITTITRHISSPITEGDPFKIGDWIPGSTHPTILLTTSVQYTGSNVCFDNDSTSFIAKILDADGITILEQAELNNINGNITHSSDNITVIISGWTTQYNKYKGNINVNYDLDSILPNGGRFSIIMEHHSGSNIYTKSQLNIFGDKYSPPFPSIGTPTITQSSINSNKYLSGIRFYDRTDTFQLFLDNIDNTNFETYSDNLLQVTSNTTYGIADYGITSTDLTNWTTLYNNTGSTYSAIKAITRTNFRNIGNGQVLISPKYSDFNNTYGKYTSNIPILIDTYTATSTDTNEDFFDENKRLTSTFTSWNSRDLLGTNDLQIINGTLRRQYGNWTSYSPENTADYSLQVTQSQYYYRQFRVANIAHSNGIFNIGGCTQANLDSNSVIFWISLDGNIWFNCNLLYSGGVLTNGAGCRINKDTNALPKLEFTLGTGGSTSSTSGPLGWGIYVKVEMPSGSSVQLTNFDITNW